MRSLGSSSLGALAALTLSMLSSPAMAQVVPPAGTETGVLVQPFELSSVSLGDSRWADNQNRTLSYLLWVDPDRLLYNFRSNHGLSTQGATPHGGWDAPDFPFRTHYQGHVLTAWAYCWSVLGEQACKDKATYFSAELKKCQANNPAKGYSEGYLSGFPESEIEAVEKRTLSNGNVPYYAIHKTMAGLLDVWRFLGDETAKDVLLGMAGWVDSRTGKLSYAQMQEMMQTEFGGMNEVLADVAHQTGDNRWLTVAQRFDHQVVFDPLAANQDRLNGLHANTQVPKWIGAAKEFKASGNTRYLDIAKNAWAMTVNAHTYAIGGNSRSEHFRPPNAIAEFLDNDTCEACNTYNMLKLTRELWVMDPEDTDYFDFYERALLNHLLGAQNPESDHGHITYFTPLNPGGRRGVGPAWGGGTWSTDDDSFWCCQGTQIETNSKLMDSIYFKDEENLYVNLFIPSTLDWTEKGVRVQQVTEFPAGESSKLMINGDAEFTLRIRIPSWASDAKISINCEEVARPQAGSYAEVSRKWLSGDVVKVDFPMSLHTVPANDDPSVAALAFGPVILCGNYGDSSLSGIPALDVTSVQRDGITLSFKGTSNGQAVNLVPFYEAHGFNYNVYWKI
ncbi:hypothetical protein jhhlp_000639 [Lomentospora prolificans]|uniref:Secreted protein n=1 Tax=Lomentospora prolificans TaxID=41688 RepID=A0A2N3NJ30_9PEZI|nr:hypothetical protein jhhlp_000639 [Lomentospora prolificans]